MATAELLGLLSGALTLGLKLKDGIEKIKNNQHNYREIAARISSSITLLNNSFSEVNVASPGLIKAVNKLKLDLEIALANLNRPEFIQAQFARSPFKQWFQKDAVEASLFAIEKQVSTCFQEFNALSNVRIEVKMGRDHAQFHNKLDELLNRTAPLAQIQTSRPMKLKQRPVKSPTSTSVSTSVSMSDTEAMSPKRSSFKSRFSFSRPPKVQKSASSASDRTRSSSFSGTTLIGSAPPSAMMSSPSLLSGSHTSSSQRPISILGGSLVTSPASISSYQPTPVFIPHYPPPMYAPPYPEPRARSGSCAEGTSSGPSQAFNGNQRHSRRVTDPVKYTDQRQSGSSNTLLNSTTITPLNQRQSTSQPGITDIANLKEKAEALDEEYRRIRDKNLPALALSPARRAMYIRRLVYSLDDSIPNTSALARSMTYVTRSIKEAAVLGEDLGEPLELLKETCQLYRALTSHDEKYRANLASSLYNVSVRQDEIGLKRQDRDSLTSASQSGEECLNQFMILYRLYPSKYGIHLANAYLNLSFVFSDLSEPQRALYFAQCGVQHCYQIEDRKVLQKSLTRVSYCYLDLGQKTEAKLAEAEANNLKQQTQ